jgi:glutamate-1-semialdehyde aminotransferase/NAD(P)-dependent dehydrogenase (short-subunit alcohol dehydrogenase family)
VWDVDGNEFIDFGMGIGPLVLGYCYPAVDDAIRRQLEHGITFSLMHPLEVEVAEQIRDLVPCAEAVRFGKTGADVTSAAVRLARASTGRAKVLCSGYHGWHDWYVAVTDRHRGVPGEVRDLTYTFEYNDLDSLDRALDADVACVILEPIVFEEPAPGFLAGVRERCTRNGSLLIFDEMWTGFRLAAGGAQARYGVTPDLATFSKAIANGMPLSVLTGRADVLSLLERDVFFFTTFGGEALSLAAAQATLCELVTRDVPAYLARQGQRLADGYNRIARSLGIDHYTRCTGPAARTIVTFDVVPPQVASPLELKSLVQQELIRHGVLWTGTHTMSFSHSDEDIAQVLAAYEEALATLKDAVEHGTVRAALRGTPVQPGFRRTAHFNTRPPPRPSGFSLVGRVAVVTGAAGLLGREHAAALAGAGASVVLVDLPGTDIAGLAAELEAVALVADVTVPDNVAELHKRVMEQFGRADVLVNNAAVNDKVEGAQPGARSPRLEEYSLAEWRHIMDVNVTGVFLPSQVFGAAMAERGGGSIINIASTYALVGPDPSLYTRPDGSQPFLKSPAYPASKGAVLALTRFLAAHWGRRGVRVNALVPGGVRNGQEPYFVERYGARTPLGRMAAPDDYRGALVFLASDASRYMTGGTLVVDGGFTAW